MRITVKCIIKWGLIAEILTAIIGQVGEFALRYRAYSSAFDELFGRYRLHELSPRRSDDTSFPLDPHAHLLVSTHPPFRLDPNYQLYEHRSGRAMRMPSPPPTTTLSPSILEPITPTTDKSVLANIFETAFRTSIRSKVASDKSDDSASTLFSFDSYSKSLNDVLTLPSPVDPRPFLVCTLLVTLNLLFLIGIAYEYLPLICPLTIFSLLYLILLLLVLHAGASTSTSFPSASTQLLPQSPWTILTPSPFTILVLSIILIFSLLLVAIIIEERRQVSYRIRAKSAAIPLVKSRDMDLDEI